MAITLKELNWSFSTTKCKFVVVDVEINQSNVTYISRREKLPPRLVTSNPLKTT